MFGCIVALLRGLADREPNPGYGEDEDGYSISEPSERGDMASDQEYKSKMEELKAFYRLQ